MSRVSQLELYNDKDVITQILLMKEQVETGTYKEVRIIETGGNYVFEFVNQKDEVETFTVPAKQISGVTSSQSGSTVTMRINYNDGTHQDVNWTAGGDVTTNTNQTISAVKTFTASPIIPDTPSGTHAAVNLTYVSKTDGTNNMVHTSGNEDIAGRKNFSQLAETIAKGNITLTTANNCIKIGHVEQGVEHIHLVLGGGYTGLYYDADLYIHQFNPSAHYRDAAKRVNFGGANDELVLCYNTADTGLDIWYRRQNITTDVLTWVVIEAKVYFYGDVGNNTVRITGSDLTPAPLPTYDSVAIL